MKSFLISSFILLCCTVIESSILSNISFLAVVPDLSLICLLYVSLLNGKLFGETSGFVSGLFLDFLTGVPLGFNCLIRTAVGYIGGLFAESVIISGVIVPMLSTAAGTVVKSLLVSAVAFIFPSSGIHASGLVSYNFLFEFILNVLISPFLFRFLGYFRNSLSTAKDVTDNV